MFEMGTEQLSRLNEGREGTFRATAGILARDHVCDHVQERKKQYLTCKVTALPSQHLSGHTTDPPLSIETTGSSATEEGQSRQELKCGMYPRKKTSPRRTTSEM
jgi:hypothetical protein